jgi:CBS domain-containing protein
MKREVERCLDTSLVTEAAAAMRDRNIGFLPVSTEEGATVGTITDRDIVIRLLARGGSLEDTRIDEIMTREVIACSPSDDLAVAEGLMSRYRRSRIVCMDARKRIAGVISLSCIAKRATRGPAGTIAASVAAREASPGPDVSRMRARSKSCSEIMKPDVASCSLDDGVRRIAEIMRDRNVGFVPVCDETGAAVGTVTDRDLTLRVVAAGRSPETTRAADVMTPEVICCSPEDPLSLAEDLMSELKKSRILCIDAERRPVGVISLSDIARVERVRRVSRVLRDISSRRPRVAA